MSIALTFALLLQSQLAAAVCETELDCELTGLCVNGNCVCDEGWKGPTCTHLDLVPNPPNHYAYHAKSRPVEPLDDFSRPQRNRYLAVPENCRKAAAAPSF
jgi:hypothetical protein